MKGILRLDNVGRLELVFKKPIFDLRVFDSIAAVTYEDVNAAIQELGEEARAPWEDYEGGAAE